MKASTMPASVRELLKEPTVPQREDVQGGQPVIDLACFGKYLKGLRVRQGYEPADKLEETLRTEQGVDVSKRTIYAIERGEQLPRLDLLLALLVVLDERIDYFYPAFRDDIVARLRERS